MSAGPVRQLLRLPVAALRRRRLELRGHRRRHRRATTVKLGAADDAGKRIRVVVTASNSEGATVQGGRPPPVAGRPPVAVAARRTRNQRPWSSSSNPAWMPARRQDPRPSAPAPRSEIDRCAAVGKVIATMRELVDWPFALDETARIASLSPFYFSRVFRQLTSLPPRRFHTAVRIAAAKKLLLTTDLSVTDGLPEVAYQSFGTFTTHFHELVGVSPRELRRLAAEPWPAAAELVGPPASAPAGDSPVVAGSVTGAPPDWLVFLGLFACP